MRNGPTKKPIDIPTRETFNFLSSHLHPGATVLEIGCGDGEGCLGTYAEGISLMGRRIVATPK